MLTALVLIAALVFVATPAMAAYAVARAFGAAGAASEEYAMIAMAAAFIPWTLFGLNLILP
jgi:hypothetical protein